MKGESEQSQESTDRREAVESRARRPLLLDQNIRKKYEETPSLDIDPSLFQQLKSLEVVENLNFSSGSRVKHIDDAITRSVFNNVAQNNWKAAVTFFATTKTENQWEQRPLHLFSTTALPPLASVPL